MSAAAPFTISLGTNIASAEEPMQRIDLLALHSAIVSPMPDVVNLIKQLRVVRAIDLKRYQQMKRGLPYVVCAAFNPSLRKKENFGYADCFIVDVDHVAEAGLKVEDVRKLFESDTRVALCFVSPSGDGVKALFRLSERCHDANVYSVFYKAFVSDLAVRYGLQKVLDGRTHDVSRACFLSLDPKAKVRPDAEPIVLQQFVDTSDVLSFHNTVRQTQQAVKPQRPAEPQPEQGPDPDAMNRIKEIIAQRRPKADTKPPVVVPQVLHDIMPEIKADLESLGLEVYEVIDIQYGKQIRTRSGLAVGEVNLFCGRRGFSVVISPRRGTNSELSQATLDIIESFLAQS